MRIPITGGAGFVGSHLSEALLAAGNEIFVPDDLSTGSIDNIAHLKGRTGFACTIDRVFNTWCSLWPRPSVSSSSSSVRCIPSKPTSTGPRVVLRHANKKERLVVISSTSEVYGKNSDVPFREDAELVPRPTSRHRWAYARSKMLDEFLALAYWKERKLPAIVVRLFNTVDRARRVSTGWSCPTSSARPWPGSPSRCSATAASRKASRTLATWLRHSSD
jgi:UDP-glucose 4-epimerase